VSRVVVIANPERLSAAEHRRALAQLPRAEKDRISRFRRWQDAQASLLGWGLLHRLATECLGQADPSAIRLVRDDSKRPYVAEPEDSGVDINLSHSGAWIAAAVARCGRVGVDIQVEREIRTGVAERCYSPAELAWMRSAPIKEQALRFFRLWTLKESYLKATGQGLAADLPAISFDITRARTQVSVAGEPGATSRWRFRSWRVQSSTWLALCTDAGELPDDFERAPS
jgi:4'-phosphopantetheinyl transferase